MTATATDDRRMVLGGILLVTIASVSLGLNPVYIRAGLEAGLSPEVASLYRFAGSALCILPFLFHAFRTPRLALVALVSGACVGVGMVTYFTALDRLPVALAVLIVFTYPAFAQAFGRLFFGQRITPRQAFAAVLVLAGAGVAVGPAPLDPEQFWIAMLSFIAPAAFGIQINLLATVLAPMQVWPRTSCILAGGTVAIVPFALAAGTPLLPAEPSGYVAMAALCLFGMLLPMAMIGVGTARSGAAIASALSGIEFAVALSCGWLLLGEPVRTNQVAGAILVLAAAALAASTWRQRLRPA